MIVAWDQNEEFNGIWARRLKPRLFTPIPAFAQLKIFKNSTLPRLLPSLAKNTRAFAPFSVVASAGSRGLRLLCSDRYSNSGCGRTFSAHWDELIPGASLAAAPSRHAAWAATTLTISLTGAYRWFSRWARFATSIKTWLCSVCHPPGKTDSLPDPHNLRHLDAAFPACPWPAAAFQNRFQAPLAT